MRVRDVNERQTIGLACGGGSAQWMVATARQNVQFAADLGEEVHQQSAVGAAADLLSELVDEALRPLSHLGSVESQDPSRNRARSVEPEQKRIRMPDNGADLTPRFKLIFSTVAALTVLALILTVLLAAFGGDSEQVNAAAEACSTTYKMGFGAIVGLIGGRSA